MSGIGMNLRFPLQSPAQAAGVEPFDQKTFEDGSSLEGGNLKLEMSAPGGLFFDVALLIGGGIAPGLASNWLYHKFGRSTSRVIIREKEITYKTEDEFIQIIEREIQEVDA